MTEESAVPSGSAAKAAPAGAGTGSTAAGRTTGGGTSRPAATTGHGGSPAATMVEAPSRPRTRRGPRASLTGRAIALAVVILILVISYASSLRVYFAQAHEIAETKAEIAQRTSAIEDLQSERARWSNDDYVRAQARERLGWVVPGEIGYRVVDPQGRPLGGGEEIEGGSSAATLPDKAPWWTKLRDSVEAADAPKPAGRQAGTPTVTEETEPGR